MYNLSPQKLTEDSWQPYLPEQNLSQDLHIFSIPAAARPGEQLSDFDIIVSSVELQQINKIRVPWLKENFKRSRYFLRHVLSDFLDIHPSALNFHTGKGEKPRVNGLEYNLTRSGDFIIIAVSQQSMGIDIEYIKPGFDFTEICEQHFHEEEQNWIDNNRARFFTVWTRKEAVLKATGEGLTDDMATFSTIAPDVYRSGNRLHLNSYLTNDNYVLSIATNNLVKKTSFWRL